MLGGSHMLTDIAARIHPIDTNVTTNMTCERTPRIGCVIAYTLIAFLIFPALTPRTCMYTSDDVIMEKSRDKELPVLWSPLRVEPV